MNYSHLLSPLFSAILYLIPCLFLIQLLKSPWFKGKLGEFIVNFAAKFYLDKKTYHLIKNVTLPTSNGTTQIDHIIVSRHGVFVIETKNMQGWIFGDTHQKMWTQKIFKHTRNFQNPIHQNYNHVKTLQSLLSLTPNQMHSLVVFIGNSTFKTTIPNNVTYGTGYIDFIKSKKQLVLSDLDVAEIIQTIESGKLTPSLQTNRRHVNHVKQIIEAKNNHHNCPKCGSDMLRKEVKLGHNAGRQFLGCSNFPRCRHRTAYYIEDLQFS